MAGVWRWPALWAPGRARHEHCVACCDSTGPEGVRSMRLPYRAFTFTSLILAVTLLTAGCGATASSQSTPAAAAPATPAPSPTTTASQNVGSPNIAAVADKVRSASVMVQNLTAVPPDLAQRVGA